MPLLLDLMLDQKSLFKAIDADPSLIGAGVVFIDRNGAVITLREFKPICFVKRPTKRSNSESGPVISQKGIPVKRSEPPLFDKLKMLSAQV